jgi:hypothetical protein
MTDHLMDLSYVYLFNDIILTSDKHAAGLAESELSKIHSPISETNLFIVALPEFTYYSLEKILEHLVIKGFNSITLIVQHTKNLIRPVPRINSKSVLEKCKVVPITYHPWCCLKAIEEKTKLPIEPNWNIKKGLLRTGSLNRYTRIGILKELYNHDLLDKIVWTFPKSESQKISILNYFAESAGMIPEDFDEFYNYCSTQAITNKTPQLIRDVDPRLSSCLQNQFFTDWFVESFQHANFSIISESDFAYGAISEKTYLTLLHKHPFIIVNSPQQIQLLKSLGFRTFENYLPFDQYIYVEDNQLRLDQIVANIREFQKIIESHRQEIVADTEHNYNLCIEMAHETETQFNNLSTVLTADNLLHLNYLTFSNVDIDLFVQYKTQEKILLEQKQQEDFIAKYRIYKGADWPEIQNMADFEQLPEWVKQEAKTKFNFPRDLINRDIINVYLQNNH